jgi:translation initiation factor IF-3
MTLAEALRAAMRAGLDLVEVNPRGEPPVCKLLRLSQFGYEAAKAAARRRRAEDGEDDERDPE